jgi:two-component system response regulator
LREMDALAVEPKTVLLVEDNADDERLTLRAMRKSEIPSIIQVAHDGSEAIEYLFGENAQVPDLIVLDLKLPKLGGVEVLERIRSEKSTAGVPVVVLTSSDDEGDILRCYDLRVNSYVIKPVDFQQFTDSVGQICYYWLNVNG